MIWEWNWSDLDQWIFDWENNLTQWSRYLRECYSNICHTQEQFEDRYSRKVGKHLLVNNPPLKWVSKYSRGDPDSIPGVVDTKQAGCQSIIGRSLTCRATIQSFWTVLLCEQAYTNSELWLDSDSEPGRCEVSALPTDLSHCANFADVWSGNSHTGGRIIVFTVLLQTSATKLTHKKKNNVWETTPRLNLLRLRVLKLWDDVIEQGYTWGGAEGRHSGVSSAWEPHAEHFV